MTVVFPASAFTLVVGGWRQALILMSGSKASELGLKPLARIRGFGDAAHEPEVRQPAI